MIDKEQWTALGVEMAEQKAPLCMAKRIEELEAQIKNLTNRLAWRNTGSPNGLRRFMTQKQYDAQTPGIQKWYEPIRYELPEGWQLVPVEPSAEMLSSMKDKHWEIRGCQLCKEDYTDIYFAMLASAPRLDSQP